MTFLYEKIIQEFGKRYLAQVEVPNYITDNLKYRIRPYQKETFQRYILCHTENFEGKPSKPFHLLYNMATGSGKTLVMAGLMLYLYGKGYRNFLFFVNSNNIMQKTKDNFLNQQASKYLFREKIIIDGKEVVVKEISNFDESDNENINIKFTTIQQLHLDLNIPKENSITYEDFEDKRIVLIADEAHHLSSSTKNNSKGKVINKVTPTWENTVDMIHKANFENILLEFTATIDYENREILEKYKDKVIFKYDLKQFRLDGYSKDIGLIRSQYDEQERIIQALILNLYRQELATLHGINLKPVILFKAKRTIKESELNKIKFHQLIDKLDEKHIDKIQKTSTVEIIQKAFAFFNRIGLSYSDIVKRIKSNFKEENCISANNDEETELNQIRLNTLEDNTNPIRAVFAVQKLNEGWDVLNLFDIVRLYEGRDGRKGNPGKTTLSEAQLIGRGARYFPFSLSDEQDKYTRKYDNDISNDLRVLEELYYHTREDVKYISELKKALTKTGIFDDDLIEKNLKLKEEFKNTNFYHKGKVVFNEKREKSYDNVKSFSDLGVSKHNYKFILSSGAGGISKVFTDEDNSKSKNGSEKQERSVIKNKQKDISLCDIPNHVIRYALSQNPFFYFDNIQKYTNIQSMSEFIKDYLSTLEITFVGPQKRIESISNLDYLLAIREVLREIEMEIRNNLTDYEGSGYIYKPIKDVFTDKTIKVPKNSERADGQEELVGDKKWYVYNANYGTYEEKSFVEMFDRRFKKLQKDFKDIYLIRNERVLKIYNEFGKPFEPDFILFCIQNKGDNLIYQVFIEPKGKHLKPKDKWKEDFLIKIGNKKDIIQIDSDKYLITGVPFYNYDNENEFREKLEKACELEKILRQ